MNPSPPNEQPANALPGPPRISEAEWEVMRVLWEKEEATAQDVVEHLDSAKDWSDRTIKTLLARLVKKEVIGFETQGKRYLYRPLISREECVQHESRSFLDRVFGGDVSPLLASFVRSGGLSPKELSELRTLLDEEEGR